MNLNNILIVQSATHTKKIPDTEARFIFFPEHGLIWNPEVLQYDNFLEKLVYRIARRPKKLLTHLQRIYYCFHSNLDEQLFAAIVDLLYILNKRGEALSWRVVFGAKSKLTSEQFNQLKDYLKDAYKLPAALPNSRYSILTKGMISTKVLVQCDKVEQKYDYDPLELALDYIEYSQLDEAKQVLEMAILEQPERLDIHQELLALYRSTRDVAGFKTMLIELTQLGVNLNQWNQLSDYFEGLSSNG